MCCQLNKIPFLDKKLLQFAALFANSIVQFIFKMYGKVIAIWVIVGFTKSAKSFSNFKVYFQIKFAEPDSNLQPQKK